jgi:hypothetical protein
VSAVSLAIVTTGVLHADCTPDRAVRVHTLLDHDIILAAAVSAERSSLLSRTDGG